MRIVHITNAGGFGRTQMGGAERGVAELSSTLADEFGWDEHVIAPEQFFSGSTLSESVTKWTVSLRDFSVTRALNPRGTIQRQLRAIEPDLVVTHLLRGTLLGAPANAMSSRCPCVSILHNSLRDYEGDSTSSALKTRTNRLLFRAVSKKFVNLHVAISKANQSDLVDHEGVSESQTVVLHNWVSDKFSLEARQSRDSVRAKLGLKPETRLIVEAGRLERQKNHEFAIALLRSLPGVVLAIAGEGSLRGSLQELARRHNVADRVLFLGFRPDLASLIAAADAVTVPSLYEGFGRTIIESLAAGTPVVASKSAATVEVLEGAPAETAWTIELSQPAEWRERLDSLLRDPSKLDPLRASMAAFVAANYSLPSIARKYDEAFVKLLNADPHAPTQETT